MSPYEGEKREEEKKAFEALIKLSELSIRAKELEVKLYLCKRTPKGITTADIKEFTEGLIYPDVEYEDGKLKFKNIELDEFKEIADKIREKLLQKGIAVVVTSQDVDKSALAVAMVWELFLNADIGIVARVDFVNEENYSRFVRFITNYGDDLSNYIGKLLVLYDPNIKMKKIDDIEITIYNIIDGVNSMYHDAPKPLVLIVIPEKVYNKLDEKLRNVLEAYRFDVQQNLNLHSDRGE